MSGNLISLVRRVLFAAAFVCAGLAVIERIANALHYTVLQGYAPSRLLAFAAVIVLFVIALELRELIDAQKRG
jgi:uncharacterized membrane protein YphA (DoxX/SURF4 family)